MSLLTALLENEPALACDLKESNPLPREDGKPDVFDEVFDAAGNGESHTEEADDGEVGKD